MVVQLLSEAREIITKRQKVFENNEEYYEIVEEFDRLVDLYYHDNPMKEVSEEELKKMTSALINKYFSFESKYAYAKFSSDKKDFALLARTLSYIAVIVSIILAFLADFFIIFALSTVTVFLILRECRFDERFFFVPRNINSYPFGYIEYSIVAGAITIFCFIYLLLQNHVAVGWIFLAMMAVEISILLAYQREINELKLRQKYPKPKK